MANERAIEARYADWRPVKGRKVLQVILEVPLERQSEVLQMLGAPLPDRDIWVGVALLGNAPSPLKGGKLAQEAGILCSQPVFQRFADATNPDEAADFIRLRCRVDSRAHLDHSDDAAAAFREMKREFKAWEIAA